jgi:parallel beta-helix repeat protein
LVRKIAFGLTISLLLMAILMAFNFKPVEATWTGGTITIHADGSINPSGAPITTSDNITYMLTDNIEINGTGDGIVIKRNNIILDGDGHIITGSGFEAGVRSEYNSNVTIRNTTIRNFTVGIYLYQSSNNHLLGNNIAMCSSSITLYYSSSNILLGNSIANSGRGIELFYSNSNTLLGNSIANSYVGINFGSSIENSIYQNNFIKNDIQVNLVDSSANIWDDGYPSGGNYWSDYTGVDQCWGPNQNQTGSDGIGDTSRSIDPSNVDHYPLMNPWPSPRITVRVAVILGGPGCIPPPVGGVIVEASPEIYTNKVILLAVVMASIAWASIKLKRLEVAER